MSKKLLENNQGITLITLIITIIVILILSAIPLSMLDGDNGIIHKSGEFKEQVRFKQIEGNIRSLLVESLYNKVYDAKLAKAKLEKEMNAVVEEIENGLKVKVDKYMFIVDTEGQLINMVNISEVYDEQNKHGFKLHIGDFISYTAGSWKEEDFTGIDIQRNDDGTAKIPSSALKFGGVEVGSSRDGHVVVNSQFTGWRLFDVTDDSIIIISAGCPEYYRSLYDNGYGSTSQYVLTGEGTGSSTYVKRDWSMYVNSAYKEKGFATVLTKRKLQEWYGKHVPEYKNFNNADLYDNNNAILSVNGTNLESMININRFNYWLGDKAENKTVYKVEYVSEFGGMILSVYPAGAFGLRILVSLPKEEVLISKRSCGTKNIDLNGIEYTYNVWEINN